jgi:AcrR family transcriptional regulator
MSETGLRERKKAKTRALITQTAADRFLEHGFDNVTLDEIAAECEVSVRTVLRYFDSKESLALAGEYDALQSFKDGLEARETDVLTYWREYVAETAARTALFSQRFRRHVAMVVKHPALSARQAALSAEYEDALATAIADEMDDREGLRSRLLAAMLVAGNNAVARHLLHARQALDPEIFVRVVDYASEAFDRMPRVDGPSGGRKAGARKRG